ncbi:MAG: TRAP transporter permease [Proteobacteria bacterium]|nr:TRAP transporter permease [Burkholderiales bacterium]
MSVAALPGGSLPERAGAPLVLNADTEQKVIELIEAEEGATHRFKGRLAAFITAVAIAVSLFHLYGAIQVIPAQFFRTAHVALILFLAFLLFPVARRYRNRSMWWDWLFALAGLSTFVYVLIEGWNFAYRAIEPTTLDVVMGTMLILLLIEATRRTTGWVMVFVISSFLIYAFVGPWLPQPWTHRGYDVARLAATMYMTVDGVYGTAVDVSSSLIILFCIYGAFLQFSGAGKFFLDFSFAAMGSKPTNAGRTVVLASFLLGGPSGSGVATTVTIGSVAYPMLKKAGYPKNPAGGLLAAGGLGAIISPPVLGAAAFIIAEFLRISYLDVIQMAIIPTLLYYLSLFLMVEFDARKYGNVSAVVDNPLSLWQLTKTFWFHFLSLVAIIVYMMWGYSPTASVFWATVTAFGVSFLHRDSALLPYELFQVRGNSVKAAWANVRDSGLARALREGTVGMLNVGVTCAAAGIIVGVVTLTGLGLKFSSIVIGYAEVFARGFVALFGAVGLSPGEAVFANTRLLFTTIFTALIVWIVGLAVPVTASYIICAVVAAPALIKLGVPDYAAHMFIFYYAVLSEVSPPTALSPFAAAAITGGDPYRTTLQSWKYVLPAFVVPFMFVLDPAGIGLLLRIAPGGTAWDVVWVTLAALVGICALAAGAQGWLFRRTIKAERGLLIVAGLLLVYTTVFTATLGVLCIAAAALSQHLRRNRVDPAPGVSAA